MDAASGSTNYLPDMSKIAHPTVYDMALEYGDCGA
jgi:hypothetical protein